MSSEIETGVVSLTDGVGVDLSPILPIPIAIPIASVSMATPPNAHPHTGTCFRTETDFASDAIGGAVGRADADADADADDVTAGDAVIASGFIINVS
ncbi:MAG TPA: hypothetical protein ENF52_02510, partial [Chloroflexi bacterium]|nr:hypothetical protein [Chloroflexota bacterium]